MRDQLNKEKFRLLLKLIENKKTILESVSQILLYLFLVISYYTELPFTVNYIWATLGLLQRFLFIKHIRKEYDSYSKIV